MAAPERPSKQDAFLALLREGWTSLQTLGSLAVAVLLLAAFLVIESRVATRFRFGHLVSFFVDSCFGLEIFRHQLDDARDQILDVGLGLDCAAIDEALHQMIRERVDLSFPHRH